MPLLAVTAPGRPLSDGESIALPEKTLSGLAALSKAWGADFVFLTDFEPGAPPLTSPRIDQLPFQAIITHDRLSALHHIRPSITLVNLAISELEILEDRFLPKTILAENGLYGRLAWAQQMHPGGRVTRREQLGLIRLEAHYRRAIRRAKGLQLNGYPASAAYGHLNRQSMMFFDSRVTTEMVNESLIADRQPAPPIRLAFSGRWIHPKGFTAAIAAFQLANRRLGHSLTLDLLGDGELRQLTPISPQIHTVGNLNFSSEWVPRVRTSIDILLIPHTQPDPACTYLEGAGVGAPFISFDNEAAAGLARHHGFGWISPLGDIERLAQLIEQVVTDRDEIKNKSQLGLNFMREHSFEQEFMRRAEHLRACAKGPR